jgi:hypothetical protein
MWRPSSAKADEHELESFVAVVSAAASIGEGNLSTLSETAGLQADLSGRR